VDANQGLGLLQAVSVSLDTTGDILDSNGAGIVNIRATNLRMVADSNDNSTGTIGRPTSAIDTDVAIVASQSEDGIYLHEVASGGGLIVGHVEPVLVEVTAWVANFNSSLSQVSTSDQLSGLDDLVTTKPRHLTERAIEVQVDRGSLIITDGMDADGLGVHVTDFGSILLTTIQSGNIAIATGIQTDGTGDAGNISLLSAGWIDELPSDSQADVSDAVVVADSLTLSAQGHVHLHKSVVNSLVAQVGKNGTIDGAWQQTNAAANAAGDDFLDALGDSRQNAAAQNGVMVEVDRSTSNSLVSAIRESYDEVARQFRFEDTYQGQYALFLRNTKSLIVDEVVSGIGAGSVAPNVYIETLGGNSDLTVLGTIATLSSSSTEGGVILVAGGDLDLVGQLVTLSTLSSSETRVQVIDRIGDGLTIGADGLPVFEYLNGRAFDGGEGVPPGDNLLTSTQFVIRDQKENLSLLAEDFRTHVFQRVVMQFGFNGEAGFVSLVGYADGEIQQFDVAGETGVRSKTIDQLDPLDQSAIEATLAGSPQATAFTRATAFNNEFIDSNQMLPTTIVVRRAADFFLFEHAAEDDGIDLTDLTVESFEVENVFALGAQGATELPSDIEPMEPPTVPSVDSPVLLANPTQLVNVEIELEPIRERVVEVAIYRVYFEDENDNGQADESELPSSEEILSAEVVSDEQGNEESIKVEPKKRWKLESVKTNSGGSPTAEDIESLKNEYLNDPTRPSGAYAIIEKGIDDQEIVLDVFSVRDIPEDTGDSQTPIIRLPANEQQEVQQEDLQDSEARTETNEELRDRLFTSESPRISSRFQHAGLVASSIWFVHVARSSGEQIVQRQQDEDQVGEPIVSFSRQARRSRRWKRKAK
jgi:hypothetical protein